MVITKIKTIIEPDKGVTIGPVIKEASILALKDSTNVEFTFNDKRYEILMLDLLECCKEIHVIRGS
jgi:hypothetical protein